MTDTKPFDIAAARARVAKRSQDQDADNLKLYEQASKDASTIIARIIEIASPKRIYQWGSLLQPDNFRDYSDIDVAVEGVPDAETFFAILAAAERLTTFPVDIVQMEKIEPEFANDIRHAGRIVYEKQ